MAESVDPSILLLRNEVSALTKLVQGQIKENVTTNLQAIANNITELSANFLNSMKDANSSLEELAKNSEKQLSAIENALKAQEEKLKQQTQRINQLTSTAFKMSAEDMRNYEDLVAATFNKTGESLEEANARVNAHLKRIFNNNTEEFNKFNQQYIASTKNIIEKNYDANKTLEQMYSPEIVAKIEKTIDIKKEEKLTLEQKKELLEKLQLTEEELTEEFIRQTIETANQSLAVAKLTDHYKKLKEAMEFVDKQNAVHAQGLTDMSSALSKYADKLAAEHKTLFGGMIKNTLDFRKESHGVSDFYNSISSGVGKSIESLLSYDKMIDRVFGFMQQRMIMPTFEFAKAIAQVNKETGGFGKEFETSAMTNFMGLQASNVGALGMYGVSLEKYGKAYGDLANKIGGFNDMSDKQRKILAANAAALETLGISTDTYAKLTTGFMGALQKNTLATRDAIEGLAKDAISLGKNVGQYTREFEQFMPKLIGYGREASTIFKEVSAFAQATKGAIQSSDIMALSEKFQTFEGAAESVSKLNAMLGGVSVNILDVMGKDPAQIAMTVKRAANEANLEFDKLNIGYKRMLSEAFGGDMQKVAAFYKMDLAEAQEYMDRSAATEKELEERKRKSVAAQEKLNSLLDNMKIALTPILDIFGGIASILAAFQKNATGIFLTVGVVFTGMIAGAVFMWNKFKLAAVNAANLVNSSMHRLELSLERISLNLDAITRKLGAVAAESKAIGPNLLTPPAGRMAGFGKAMGAVAIGMTALSLLGMGGKAISENIAEGPQDHSEAGIIGPNGKITPNAGNNFIYRNGNVTTFNSRDMVGTAKEGEQVFLQPSVSNMTNTSNTISNGPSSRTDWVTQLMSPELPIVKSTKELSSSLVLTNKESAKSVQVAKESLKLEYATKELRESANLRKESEVQRQREVFENAFTSEKVTAQLTKQPAINNYFKVGRKEMKLFTEEASGEMTEAVASNFVSRGIVKG